MTRLGQEHAGQGRPAPDRPAGRPAAGRAPKHPRPDGLGLNGWLLAYDNVGVIPGWLSDGLCMLSTGGAFADHARSPATSSSALHAQRPVILNGIEEFVGRGDLGDRSVFLDLPPIAPSTRRCEDEFWDGVPARLSADPGGTARRRRRGLAELPSVRLPQLPRMADFADSPRRSAESSGGRPGRLSSTITTTGGMRQGQA